MKVFISWSGAPSRQLAEALHWWLPKVIQGTTPFVSAKDIDKGATWAAVLAKELEDTDFGLVCLTPENTASPWLHYEAGALSKSVDARVCPVLLGVEKSAVSPPLNQLQLTATDEDDIRLMVRSMNKSAGSPLTEPDLDEAVAMWWPRLQEKLANISLSGSAHPESATEPARPVTTETEVLNEVLAVVRRLERETRRGRLPSNFRPPMRDDWDIDLAHALISEGINVLTSAKRSDVLSITASDVPEPLPGKSYSLLSKAALEHQTPIRLASADDVRLVAFDATGFSEEPPF